MEKIKCLVLLSGGLDSRLAVKIMQEQLGEEGVEAVFFILPFAGGCCQDKNCVFKFCQKHNVKLHIKDVRRGKLFKKYMELIRNPEYSIGRGLNPCIDCHLFMFKEAEKLARKIKAGFLVTGEVLGERPLSQRKKPLLKIEDELDMEILRPLSAKLLPETKVEKGGGINRGKLFSIQGRSRKKQIKLAEKYKIDYPQPAGGCKLCEKEYCKKLKRILDKKISYKDIELLSIGRHFKDSKIVLGRDEEENKELEEFSGIKIIPKQPGPTALIRKWKSDKKRLIKKAKELIKKYSKHDIKDFYSLPD